MMKNNDENKKNKNGKTCNSHFIPCHTVDKNISIDKEDISRLTS